jgi:hypothetical protein
MRWLIVLDCRNKHGCPAEIRVRYGLTDAVEGRLQLSDQQTWLDAASGGVLGRRWWRRLAGEEKQPRTFRHAGKPISKFYAP